MTWSFVLVLVAFSDDKAKCDVVEVRWGRRRGIGTSVRERATTSMRKCVVCMCVSVRVRKGYIPLKVVLKPFEGIECRRNIGRVISQISRDFQMNQST